MLFGHPKDKSFMAVAICMILAGVVFFVFGVLGWWVNVAANQNLVAFPSIKAMGGLMIMALGYIQLELGLLRNK
jgi:hypothetical protein